MRKNLVHVTKEPNKILFIDIETAPSVGMYFDLWKEGNIVKTLHHGYILSFAYKWLGDKNVNVVGLPMYVGYGGDKQDDSLLCADMALLLSEADVIIAHNGDKFDIPKIYTRLIKHGFKPPEPFKTIDTYKVAKRHFKFESNRLNDLGVFLGLGKKAQTGGIDLWHKCMEGDSSAWKTMLHYNAQDVVLLELVYQRLKPWIKNHPNMSIKLGCDGCPNCGNKKLQRRGQAITLTGTRQRYQCMSCGAWSTGSTEKIVNIS